jgi:predicted dehydrogenase
MTPASFLPASGSFLAKAATAALFKHSQGEIMRAARSHPIRYAVVGLGHIAQVAVLPGFVHARKNSRLTALVSGDRRKLEALSRRHRGVATFTYEQYEECLAQVDAVYIALPNSMHAEYTIRAANAGVHVLCEKPMAVTAADCERMIEACEEAQVKLMIAYRLHFDDVTLSVLDLIRRRRIGEPKFFNSSFSLTVRRGDIRTQKALGGGTLYDIGIYCINAARQVFDAEPKEVMAVSVNSGARGLEEIDESTGALLRFDGERVAAFVSSFNADDVGSYRVLGTKGQLHVEPAYEYAEGLKYTMTVNGKTTRSRKTAKHDQFGAEIEYFSQCIQKGRAPEPSGYEGLQDVRIIEALYESAETGKAVAVPPFEKPSKAGVGQRITKPGVKKPALVRAQETSLS